MSPTGTHLEREIREQPAVIERLFAERTEEIARLADELRARELGYVLIAARGSSDNAARYAQYLFGERLHIPVGLAAPSLETLYRAGAVPSRRGGLVIGISQSGRSPDIVSVLAAATESGTPTIAITNERRSPLAKAANFVVELRTGPERSVAATKTYTASLAVLAALAAELHEHEGDRAALRRVPTLMSSALERAFDSVPALDALTSAHHVLAVGRGYNYGTAMEIALKIRELTATVAEGYSPADLMHGPIAAVAEGTVAVVIAARGKALANVLETAATLRQRGARTIVISEQRGAHLRLPPGVPEWLSPLIAVLPGQVLSLYSAARAGRPIDQPPSLTKVTETR